MAGSEVLPLPSLRYQIFIYINLPSEIFWSEKWQSIAETLSNALHTFKIKLVHKIHRVYIKCAQGGKPIPFYRPSVTGLINMHIL